MSKKINKNSKLDIKKILIAILAIAIVIGVLTGKISLANLLGLDTGTPAATESGAVSSEVSTLPETPAATGEVITLAPVTTVPAKETTAEPKTTAEPTTKATEKTTEDSKYVEYKFRNKDRLDEHYEKHGKEMGFKNAAAYQKAASDIINDPDVMHKYKSDGSGDQCFFVEKTNEFVVLSNDGYIRTYFICSGIKYYNRQ